uniref:Uncharacterized protein n=1 Tax=Romanomermis culicivorax TaxID=13658 RepID=A0A915K7G3_ROMCU
MTTKLTKEIKRKDVRETTGKISSTYLQSLCNRIITRGRQEPAGKSKFAFFRAVQLLEQYKNFDETFTGIKI